MSWRRASHWWQRGSKGYFSSGFKHTHRQAEAASQGNRVEVLPCIILLSFLSTRLLMWEALVCSGVSLVLSVAFLSHLRSISLSPLTPYFREWYFSWFCLMFFFTVVTAWHPLYLFLLLQSSGLAYKELSVYSDLCLSVPSVLFLEERCALPRAPPQLEGGASVQHTDLFLPPHRSLLDCTCERYRACTAETGELRGKATGAAWRKAPGSVITSCTGLGEHQTPLHVWRQWRWLQVTIVSKEKLMCRATLKGLTFLCGLMGRVHLVLILLSSGKAARKLSSFSRIQSNDLQRLILVMRTYSFCGKLQIRRHSFVTVSCIAIKTWGLTW